MSALIFQYCTGNTRNKARKRIKRMIVESNSTKVINTESTKKSLRKMNTYVTYKYVIHVIYIYIM